MFSLDEVKTLVQAADGGKRANQTLRKLAVDKVPEMDRQLQRLTLMRKILTVAQSCSCPSMVVCAKVARAASRKPPTS